MKLDIKDLICGKFIAAGYQGAVHKAYDKDGKKYAIKIIRTGHDESDIITKIDTNKPVGREIAFATNLGNLHPNNFIYLYTHDFIDNANDFKYERPLGSSDKTKSNYAHRLVYDYVDDILKNIIHKLSKKALYSMICQVANAINILHKHGYSHCDLKLDCVGVKYTDEKYVDLDDTRRVRTYGHIFKLIDYGRVFHKSYNLHGGILEIYDSKKYKEIDFLIYILYKCDFNDRVFSNKLHDIPSSFKHHHLYKDLEKYSNITFYKYFLFAILHPKEHQQLCSKNIYHNTSVIKLLLPLHDILYLIKYKRDNEKIIKHFSKLI